jgi:hypothetical protein
MPMFAKALESIQLSGPRQAAYTRWIVAILAVCLAIKALWFSRLGAWHDRTLVDFDAFYIIARHVWLGDVDQAYQFVKLVAMQREMAGADSFMPWTYPPQFSLLLAPLALLPTGIAYAVFTALTLAFFLYVLRSLAGNALVLLLIILFPAIEVTLACGQNGFLTAGLIGLVCRTSEERPVRAGAALGLMIIKPHLAIAFAAYFVLRRSWTVVFTAASVVIAIMVVCTAMFGVGIWSCMLKCVRESTVYLEQGAYPLYRMISVYAALRTAGLSSGAAFLGQAVVAALALGLIPLMLYWRMPVRRSLGLVAMVSLCVSPYVYDYDFLIAGIGLALLLPELQTLARPAERSVIYLAAMLIGTYGILQASWLGNSHTDALYLDVSSIGGFVLFPLIGLICVALRRDAAADAMPGFSISR